ncbi:hypothetical protein [Pseudodesulfovibrio methanolicus]|uniref:Phenylglyoxylate dehydrogenase n=1 Tax=Pseudodesulfovibrio methanolicus TaxID=3126690 RepID=A0ABZ2IZI3_9BACT
MLETRDALTGNECAAHAVRLCRVDRVVGYPITPQSSVVEYIAAMVANGEMSSEFVAPESEYAVMSILKGAGIMGERVFTATSGQGLAFMYEPYFSTSTARIPMVMAIANREMISPVTVWSGLQDAHSVRDAGWIHLYAESNQEILDSIIQGYMIAEHPDVMIPVHVCYDGFYLSHQSAVVNMPDQAQVDTFLPAPNVRQMLDVNEPRMVDGNTPGDLMMEYREDHLWSMKRALDVVEEANDRFAEIFGRNYGGLLDTYRLDDADEVLVVIGALSGAAKDAVDDARGRGAKVGLIRIRCLRPFPSAKLGELLAGRKAVGVVDKSVNFGWSSGIVYQEVLGALGQARLSVPTLSAIGGLGGSDIRREHISQVIKLVHECARTDRSLTEAVWLRPDMLQD